MDLEPEGQVEDVCEPEEEEEDPAAGDEELPGASAAQVLVLEDGPYLIEAGGTTRVLDKHVTFIFLLNRSKLRRPVRRVRVLPPSGHGPFL